MVGRKPSVSNDDLINVLKLYKEDVYANIGHSTAVIWTKISEHLNKKMSAGAVYTFVRLNRMDCQSTLGFSKVTDEAKSENVLDNSDFHSSENDSETDIVFQSKNFITIDNLAWFSILNSDSSLKSMWTDVIFEHLISNTQTKCTWMFKRYKFGLHYAQNYFTCYGYCPECKAQLKCWICSKPNDVEKIQMYYSINEVPEFKHSDTKKRPLSGEKRNELGKRFCDGKMAVNWRREQARESKDKRTIYTLDVLRKCRQEIKQRTKFSETESELDPLQSLLKLKYTENFCTTIHRIGLDPFFAMYWTSSQIITYKDYLKGQDTKLFIDATGTLCNKLKRPSGNSNHIFLYAAVINMGTADGQIPVSQMLSESQTMNQITFWLTEWVGACADKIPKTVVCDHSLALLGAVARSIAGEVNLSSYIQKELQAIQTKTVPNLKTYIRIDYPHVMKFISCWKCFRDKPITKRFYLKLIARLIRVTNFEEAQLLIENILITANSIYEGCDINDLPLPSENAKLYLKKVISQLVEVEIQDDDSTFTHSCNSFKEETDIDIQFETNTAWIDAIELTAKAKYVTESSGLLTERENFHYLPEFSKSFMKLLKTYTLWSAIMTKSFTSTELTSSSAPVESYFNDLKNRTFRSDALPIRVDKFICQHIKEVEGMIKLVNIACNDQKIKIQPKCDVPENKDLNIDNATTIVENWKGLGQPITNKNIRNSFYAFPNPEILYLEERRKIEIPLIKNGNLVNKKSATTIGDGRVILANTCAFDSIIQGFATAYCDSPELNLEWNSKFEDITIFQCIKELTTQGFSQQFIKLRALLLKDICEADVLKCTVLLVKCQMNISAAFEKICSGIESIEENYSCEVCQFQFNDKKKTIWLNPKLQNLTLLENHINNIFKENGRCRMCSRKVIMHYRFGSQIFIDCENLDLNIKCREIPLVLAVDKKRFILRFAIAYKGSRKASIHAFGHYYSLCRRIDGAWEQYNDIHKKVIIDKGLEHNVHCLIYTI